jgi:hypothetical protein
MPKFFWKQQGNYHYNKTGTTHDITDLSAIVSFNPCSVNRSCSRHMVDATAAARLIPSVPTILGSNRLVLTAKLHEPVDNIQL